MLFSSRNELLLVQTWTPGWAPGPVWTPKKLFSRRNELGSWPCWDPKGVALKQK